MAAFEKVPEQVVFVADGLEKPLLHRDLRAELIDLRVQIPDFLLQLLLCLLAHPGPAVDLLCEHLPLCDQHIGYQLLNASALGGGVNVERVERGSLLDKLAFLHCEGLDPTRSRGGNRDQSRVRQDRALQVDAPGIAAEGDQHGGGYRKRKRRESGERCRQPQGQCWPALPCKLAGSQ